MTFRALLAVARGATAAAALTVSTVAQPASTELPLRPHHAVAIVGPVKVDYRVTFQRTRVSFEDRALAEIISLDYIRDGSGATTSDRPVIFFFPGGPGSAASGLALGGFAPQVVDYSSDVDRPSPARLIDNHQSLIDIADLVFVDMPGVGFSRLLPDVDGALAYGVRQDARVQAEFVRQWLRANKRDTSSVFLTGKSYGAIRASYTGLEISRTYPDIDLAGLVILSGAWDVAAMDFPRYFTATGDNSAYWSWLPTYAALAHHYGKAGRGKTFEDFVEAARRFALHRYAPALLSGGRVSADESGILAKELAAFTGLPVDALVERQNRIDSSNFQERLVPGRPLGLDNGTFTAKLDPHEFGGDTALDTAWEAYIRDLGVKDPASYVDGSARFAPDWDWLVTDRWRLGYPRAIAAIVPLMEAKPKLRIFVAAGYFDMATPFFMAENAVAALPAPRATLREYPSGHSLWVHAPTRTALQKDMRLFVEGRR
ncbi:S10 family serine carboxypeptidase-like protein [Sphingopyxis fribergensis]